MTPAPTIERIELFPLHVPFRAAGARGDGALGRRARHGDPRRGAVDRRRLRDRAPASPRTAVAGVGEAFVWLPETGVSPAQIVDAVQHGLARYLLGASPFDVEPLRARMDANVARSEVAKGLLDMACYDLMGQHRRPLRLRASWAGAAPTRCRSRR